VAFPALYVEAWSVNVIVCYWNVTKSTLTGNNLCRAAFEGVSLDDMTADRRVEVIPTTVAALHGGLMYYIFCCCAGSVWDFHLFNRYIAQSGSIKCLEVSVESSPSILFHSIP
jgi:hypothetical protein